jgi:hypothetical protein
MAWAPVPPKKGDSRYKDDVDLQVRLDQDLREVSYTKAELGNEKSVANTIGKYKGKKVWCEELETYLFAAGTRAYDVWSDGKGFYSVYPGSAKFSGTITAPGVQRFSAEYKQKSGLKDERIAAVSPEVGNAGIRNKAQIIGQVSRRNIRNQVQMFQGTMTNTTPFTFDGNVVINGNLTVNGSITVTGTVDGVNLSSHTHSGVTSGGDSTGGPN